MIIMLSVCPTIYSILPFISIICEKWVNWTGTTESGLVKILNGKPQLDKSSSIGLTSDQPVPCPRAN